MRKLLVFTVVFFFMSVSYSETIRHKITLPEPTINKIEGYSKISYKNSYNYGKAGAPLLPHILNDFLLPQGEIVESIKIVSKEYYPIRENILIQPAGKDIPLSKLVSASSIIEPDSKIYNKDEFYPVNIVQNYTTEFLNGHSIGSLAIVPLNFNPVKRSVNFLKEIELEIVTAADNRGSDALKFLRKNSQTQNRIKKIVENPNMLDRYNYSSAKTGKEGDEVDLLIITSEALSSAFNDFIEYKEATGYFVKLVTTGSIYGDYSGRDKQEKIRNCIIDYYQNKNLKAVLLGGDSAPGNEADNIIPHRGFYATNGGSYYDLDVPSDMYYGCLDGSWNDNDNSKWGEVGEDDLLAEITVGRICADNESDIQKHLNKVIKYSDTPVVEDINKAAFIGEKLWSDPEPDGTYGGTAMEELITGASINGFNTVGIPDHFIPTRLYELDGSWSKDDIYEIFNETGVNILCHLGHSMTNYNMKLQQDDITTANFQNNGDTRGYVIGYSQGCYAGSFDNRGTVENDYTYGDCMAEKLTNLATGEVAFIANSRYGWGSTGGTDGGSHLVNRHFIDAIFNDNFTKIGMASQSSKEKNIAMMDIHGALRWSCYEATLFGDPTMDIWTDTPTDFNPNFPSSVILTVNEIEFNTAVSGSRIALVQDGVLIGRAIADESGDATVYLSRPLTSSEIELSITSHNRNRYKGGIIPIEDGAYVGLSSLIINDTEANNDGQIDFSETIYLDFTFKNYGNQTVNNLSAILSSDDSYIEIIEGSVELGALSPGQTSQISKQFEIHICDSIPNQHEVNLIIAVAENSEVKWNSNRIISLNAPDLQFGSLTIDDSNGNNNGFLDPGENVELIFDIKNMGNSTSEDIDFSVGFSNNSIMNISGFNNIIEGIAAGTSREITLSAEVFEQEISGVELFINLTGVSGGFSFERAIPTIIGVTEDFESADFSDNPWSFSGDFDWTIDDNTVYSGNYSARSLEMGGDKESSLELSCHIEAEEGGEISFYSKVSSEMNYDYLRFYIDEEEVSSLTGEIPWQFNSYELSKGLHDFKWSYTKDIYGEAGSDCGWVDFIIIKGKYANNIEDENSITGTRLYQNYPNPFNPATTIRFSLKESSHIDLSVFNVKGELVSKLVNKEMKKGSHNITFNAEYLNSGLYYYRIKTTGKVITRKMLLVK